MIIECEACGSKFNLNEDLLRPEGSRVKCTRCQHIFMAYPPPPVQEEGAEKEILDEDMEETLAMETPSAPEEEAGDLGEEEFGRAFEEAMEEAETLETVSRDYMSEEEEGEPPDLEEAMERAARIEEEVRREKKDREEAEAPTMAMEREKVASTRKKKIKPPRSKVLPIIVIVFLVVFGGGAGLVFFAPQYLPDFLSFLKPIDKQELTDVGVRRLSFDAVNGSFMQSEKAGQLFVIRGKVVNNYPKGRSFILVKGTILDNRGKVVRRKMVYAGNTFTEKELKTLDIEQFKTRSKNRFGMNKMDYNIKPGSAVPFMIVFEKLPENLSEFTVEAVSSSPAD